MSPRSLFNIILKIFGFFFLKEILDYIPKIVAIILYYNKSGNGNDFGVDLFFAIIVIGIYNIFAYMFIFKTNRIIDKFNLAEGFFENHFQWNISTPFVLKLAIIIISGVILISELPDLFRWLFGYFENKDNAFQSEHFLPYLMVSIAKILIALLLVGERKRIVGFIMEKRNATDESNEEPE